MRASGGAGLAILGLLWACCSASAPGPIPGTQVMMQFDRAAGFFAAPFPSDDLRKPDGTIDISGFPNPQGNNYVDTIRAIVAPSRGFGTTSGVLFQLTDANIGAVPDLAASAAAGSPVFLVGVDLASPDRGRRYPAFVRFRADPSVFAPRNLLSVVPLQGMPLRPETTYAAVVLRSLGGATPLGVPVEMAQLAAGERPASLPESAYPAYRDALVELAAQGVAAGDIAGLAVFRTQDPTADLLRFRDHALSLPTPAPKTPPAIVDTYPDYCVFQTTIDLPDYQVGTPPFALSGGAWPADPVVQRQSAARVFVTVPRAATPAGGWPTVVFVRTGGGGDRPLVDRGPRAVAGAPDTPGTGLARVFARAGYAAIQVDGPGGGTRNPTNADEQFLVYNFQNPPALRDNLRQSALELSVVASFAQALEFDASACDGAAAYAAADLTLFGHSTGSSIGGIAAAVEPRYGTAIFSGFGGSFIENVLYKQKPVDTRTFALLILGESDLYDGNPVLQLLQWGAEPADPPPYARLLRGRTILMLQGIVDHYIPPMIANSSSLSLALDLAGTPLDGNIPDIPDQLSLAPLLAYSGGRTVGYPVTAATVGVVAQHPADGIEDGHEVVFQTDGPKHQIRCLLLSLPLGERRVVAPGAIEAPCD
jgi:hypothetical protein